MKYTLLSFAVACAMIFAGCESKKAVAGPDAISTNIIDPLATAFAASLSPGFELGYASNKYRVAKHRWPKNYNELSIFMKQTGDKTYLSFPAVTYYRIHFAETTDGKLKIDADYRVNSTGKLGSSGTVHFSGGTNNIDFVVSPFDPREMMFTNTAPTAL